MKSHQNMNLLLFTERTLESLGTSNACNIQCMLSVRTLRQILRIPLSGIHSRTLDPDSAMILVTKYMRKQNIKCKPFECNSSLLTVPESHFKYWTACTSLPHIRDKLILCISTESFAHIYTHTQVHVYLSDE